MWERLVIIFVCAFFLLIAILMFGQWQGWIRP
jgi:hypothetical protein